jgi:hypothetical protein
MNWLPLNLAIMKNPYNWLTLVLMVMIAGLALHLLFPDAGTGTTQDN